jgi:hypothetical protein
MSDRDWRFVSILGSIGVLSLAAFSIGVAIEPDCLAESAVWKSNSETQHGDARSNHGAHVICNADCQIHFDFAESEAPTENTKHQPQAKDKASQESPLPPVEERDLCAQTRVAWWTRLIAYWSAIGAALLFWALYETRRDIRATREIGEAQVRAYLSPLGIKPEGQLVNGGITGIDFSLGVINTGQSPAENFISCGAIDFMDASESRSPSIICNFGPAAPLALGAGTPKYTARRPVSRELLNAVQRGEKRLFYIAVVGFQDVFSVAKKESKRRWHVWANEIKLRGSVDSLLIDPNVLFYVDVPATQVTVNNDPRDPNSEYG